MRRRALGLAVWMVAATAALAVALDLGPRERDLALAAYLDFVCALVLGALAATVGSSLPSSRALHGGRRPARAPTPQRPEQLASVERQCDRGKGSELELSARFLALVEQIVSAVLARRRGVSLEREPGRSRGIVGERVWSLVTVDSRARPPAAPRRTLEELGNVVDDLEAIEG
jgi:hypothetical protein